MLYWIKGTKGLGEEFSVISHRAPGKFHTGLGKGVPAETEFK